MTRINRNLLIGLIVSAVLAAHSTARAQDEKPPAAPDMAPAKAPAAPPAKAPAAAKPPTAKPADDTGAAYRAPDPAVETILESKPTTPDGMLQAALTLASLNRPDLAKQFLDQFLAAKADPASLADIARRLGSDTLLPLATNKALAPQGARVVDQILAAAAAERHDPARLAAIAKQLNDPSPEIQRDAAISLRDAGQQAVPVLLTIIADPAQAKAHSLAREALAGIGPAAIAPLAAALTAPDPAIQAAAASLLGDIPGQQDAVPYLLAPYLSPKSPAAVRRATEASLNKLVGVLPTRSDGITMLTREATTNLKRQRPLPGDESDNIVVWQWDAASKQLVAAQFPPQWASGFLAARLARDLMILAPNSVDARRLYLLGLLESAVYRAGLNAPIAATPGSELDEVARFGVPAINDALVQALAARDYAAAKAAVEILGASGDQKLLAGGETPSPLVQALRSSDRRLRVAAAFAIMQLKPTAPFAGSSYLTDVLADMAGATGHHRAVVSFPTLQPLQELAGMTNALGYQTETATNGRQLFAAAVESPDTEIVIISSRTNGPQAIEVVQQLREDPRTADLPICVLAEVNEREYVQHLMAPFERVIVETRPPNLDEMKRIVARTVVLADSRLVPVRLRKAEAAWAVGALAALASLPPEIFNVRRYEPRIERALYSATTAEAAAAALAQFGTPSSQRSLIDVASIGAQPIEIRKAAARAFRESVRRFGLRLSPSEVLAQYDRYNQSAKLDADSQRLLGGLLDVIEGKGRATGG